MSYVHVCTITCSESYTSVDSLKIGEILEEQKLDLEGVDFEEVFHERSDTNSLPAPRSG